jgi:hypothetical protein
MAFVHGHARDTGWVMAHLRRPNDAADDQIALLVLDEVIPRPREAPESEAPEPES